MNDYKELIDSLRICVKYNKTVDALCNAEFAANAIEQLVRERDEAVADLATLRHCMSCKYEKDCFGLTCNPDPNCGFNAENWEWRGVQDE